MYHDRTLHEDLPEHGYSSATTVKSEVIRNGKGKTSLSLLDFDVG